MNDLVNWAAGAIALVFIDEGERDAAAQREVTVAFRTNVHEVPDRFDSLLLVDDGLEVPEDVFGMAEVVNHFRAPAWLVAELEVVNQAGFDDVEDVLEIVRAYSPDKLDRSSEVDVFSYYTVLSEADGAAWDETYETLVQAWDGDLTEQMADQGLEAARQAVAERGDGEPSGLPTGLRDDGGE